MVEDQTGESFSDFMTREVLRPLGMVDSHFEDEPGGPHPTAKSGEGEPFDVPYHVYPEKAAAALWTTAPDLARFLIATDAIIDGETPDFLSAELAAQMLVVPDGEGEENYALGFDVVKDETHHVFRHTGANFGYKSIMYFERSSKTGLVALSDSERGFALNSMLARGKSRTDGLDFMSQRKVVPVSQSEEDWARIEGIWTFPDGPGQGRKFRFSSEGEADLYAVEIATGEVSRMVATGPMKFLDTETISPLVFSNNKNGDLEAIFAAQYRMVRAD
ncbi:serine hydrolase domain-containing protein [Erythrobacter ani]|nr:serine hydrolase domain-containing protein [Erythrobacter ani]